VIPDPTVSIVLPTFNRVALLGEAVDSVRAQTFTGWELIIADDGSTDDTSTYLEGLSDPRIRCLFLPHSGSDAVPRNAALRAARGEWVAFLDSDDLWLPSKLERQLHAMTEHPDCGWSYTGFALIDARGEPLPERPSSVYRPVSGWILESLLRFEAGPCVQSMLVRRSLIQTLGGFDEAIPLRTDYDLTVRLAARSATYALPHTLTLVREHDGRATSQRPHAELYALNERVFRKAAADAPSVRIRMLCKRQCATQLAARARALSREGARAAAFASLARALFDAPVARDVWRAAARCAVDAVRRR
jgi:glycosyltransferase involved in cell wall biosynthesis